MTWLAPLAAVGLKRPMREIAAPDSTQIKLEFSVNIRENNYPPSTYIRRIGRHESHSRPAADVITVRSASRLSLKRSKSHHEGIYNMLVVSPT